MDNKKGQVKAHDFPEIYKGFGIDLAKLGCVMLDVEAIDSYPPSYEEKDMYKSPKKERFWIDGWVADKTAHVTLLYGLLYPAKQYKSQIDEVLKDWELKKVSIEDIGFFPSPYEDDPYYCIVAHIEKSPKLVEGNERLELLPHINTFPGYKAHMTICYIKKDDELRDKIIAELKDMLVGNELKVTGINLGGDKK